MTKRGDYNIPRRRELEVEDYYQGVVSRDVAILPRALTLVESNHPRHQRVAEQLLTRLLPHTGDSLRVGITGAPGAGKSTFIEAVGVELIERGRRVAVLAVDPSSGVSGGSILGDKTRMAKLSSAPNAFIRPSPSAGTLGGVAGKTREMMIVCEAAGFEVILVETVGVGQSETMVAEMTDCFLALMLPGAGDDLQAIKRGLLELVDVIAVNKADGSTKIAAEVAAQQITHALASLAAGRDGAPQVLTCSALQRTGIGEVWDAIEACYVEMKSSGALAERHRRQRSAWLWRTVDNSLRQAIRDDPQVSQIRGELERDVLEGKVSSEAAARQILEAFGLIDGRLQRQLADHHE